MIYNIRTFTTLICLNPQDKSNEKARQELLKNNETITKAMKESKEQLEQMKEVSKVSKKMEYQTLLFWMNHMRNCSVSTNYQAEKKLKGQLTSLEQQHSKTQGALKEKENEVEKLQTQLKTTQGSFEEEMKKLKGRLTELQEVNAKKVSSSLFYCLLQTTVISPNHIATAPFKQACIFHRLVVLWLPS